MKTWTWRNTLTEAKLLLIGIPLFLWTMIPVYHLVLFAISPRDSATSGRLWPKEPTLQNFNFVFYQKHFYLDYFWIQLGNSVLIATAVAFITLVISTFADVLDHGRLRFAQQPVGFDFGHGHHRLSVLHLGSQASLRQVAL